MQRVIRALVVAASIAIGGGTAQGQATPDKPDAPKDEPKPDAPKPDKPDAPKGDKKKEKPLDDAGVKERLAKQKLTLNFNETPFSEAIAFLQDMTGLSYVIDPAIDANAKVTVKVKDVTLDAALKLIVAGGDAQYEVWRALVFVTAKKAPKKPAPAAKLADDVTKTLETKRMTLNFDGTPIGEALAFVKDLTGLEVALDDAAAKGLNVSLRVRDVSARTVLESLCRVHGLKLEAAGKGLKLVKR